MSQLEAKSPKALASQGEKDSDPGILRWGMPGRGWLG